MRTKIFLVIFHEKRKHRYKLHFDIFFQCDYKTNSKILMVILYSKQLDSYKRKKQVIKIKKGTWYNCGSLSPALSLIALLFIRYSASKFCLVLFSEVVCLQFQQLNLLYHQWNLASIVDPVYVVASWSKLKFKWESIMPQDLSWRFLAFYLYEK